MLSRLGWGFYGVGSALLTATAAPFFLLRRGGRYRGSVLPRLGWPGGDETSAPGAGVGGLWIHAVSVGEVGVARTLVSALPPNLPLVITTVTPTGQGLARKAFGDRAAVTYLPFDVGLSVRRFFRRYQPRALVLVEGDLWPRVLREAHRHGLSRTVVNGRISDRSFARLNRLGSVATWYYQQVDQLGVQTEDDRQRLLRLGLAEERVQVTGNLKFDTAEPKRNLDLEKAVELWAAARPVVVAGSTMAGEEEQVLDAWRVAGGSRSLLMLAPRHPERFDAVARLLAQQGVRFERRSESRDIDSREAGAPASPKNRAPEVVLLDTLGELATLYRNATLAFVGGTLVPTGGHNPIEPARFGIPVSVGPSMENFREIAVLFEAAEAWGQAPDAETLGAMWKGWLDDSAARAEVGRRSRELVASHRGATQRTLALLEPVLEPLMEALPETPPGDGGLE
ncbi:MAG: 3-deoxy-D-manno-octulosonic acid transferase [Acidobacteriota bacterium]